MRLKQPQELRLKIFKELELFNGPLQTEENYAQLKVKELYNKESLKN